MQNFENFHEQRMTDAEAQEVMRLLAERQRRSEELHAMPTVQDVAMLANSHVTDVAAALNEVRTRGVQQPVVLPKTKPWLLPLVAICSACAVLVVLATLFVTLRATAPSSPTAAEVGPVRALDAPYPVPAGDMAPPAPSMTPPAPSPN
jgi:hypothetical protein